MIQKRLFDRYNNQDVYAYTLSDTIDVTVCNLGATVLSLKVPDKHGNKVDVALGMTTAKVMVDDGDYMGAVVGRCGNRIANSRFTLNGVNYQLATNNGPNHLHGGNVGFNQKNFATQVEKNSLICTLVSPDGDEGYPGELTLTVKYTVEGSSLVIEYFAESSKDTICNPTNHTYFNLNGEGDGSIADNVAQIYADSYLEIDENLIPTVRATVDGTPFDFRIAKPIGRDIDDESSTQLKLAGGYDHNYCLNGSHAATVYSTKTGIQMDVYTDCVGMQFYSGNFLKGQVGKSVYNKRSGFCMETQYYPNAVNRADFDSPVLTKGKKFYSKTVYKFSVKNESR